ncbi:hypothetical protein TWF718_005872 [Orbilia javanica]|uniref:F-box domain-containing protein n=1 Tax=Orbilia javanica TaxID=47235 RepID=A0AAN8RJR6_9PEZI
MNFLPVEILSEIANQKVLSNKDLASLACVNHRFNEAACTRLYRSGELSYVGSSAKDIAKVDSYGRNGKFVRILKLNLFTIPTVKISIPDAIFPLLTTFINLHRIHLTDSATLPWPSFLHVLAIIITSHPYLKILEVQRTLTKLDGRCPTTKATSLIESHKSQKGGRFSKLDVFILRLSKSEEPYLISRAAINDLITVLLPATRSAKAFTYSADCWESPDIDLKGTVGEDVAALSWEWDNLEELTLKLPEPQLSMVGTPIGPANPSWAKNLSVQKDLGNLKRLALRVYANDLLSDRAEAFFIGGLSVIPNIEHLRITHSGRAVDWIPKSTPNHPFYGLAEAMPNLKYIEQTDSYYLTRRIQCLGVFRSEEGDVKFDHVNPEETWLGYYKWDQ